MTTDTYGLPLLINEGQPPQQLRKISLSGSDYNEEFVQRLAFEHPACLPIAEIDRAYEELVPICMELNTPAGPMDALYVTRKGRIVILEAKLWRNPEARRKVIAQILDYAKELSRWSYADLQREVSRRLGKRGNVLYELVANQYPDVEESAFVDEVQQSLERGRFLLLILGDGIREGVASIAEFLERNGSLEFTFGLVELGIYKANDQGLFVQPRIVAQSAIINRSVVQLAPGLVLAGGQEDTEEASSELNDSQLFYQGFWLEFTSGLSLDDPDQPVPKTTKIENLYFAMPPSGSACWVSASFSRTKQRVQVYITWARGAFADSAYARLQEEQEQIDHELGNTVEWGSNGTKHHITVRQEFSDVWADSEREAIKKFFAENVNCFVNTFRGRMKRIGQDFKQQI